MPTFSSLFSQVSKVRRDGDPVDKLSTESEQHLLPKDGYNEHIKVPRVGPKIMKHPVVVVSFALLWGMTAFSAGLMAATTRGEGTWGSFEDGFVEEQVITPSDVFELTRRVFTGGVDFGPDGTEILGPSDFVGEPTSEIDAAWDAIIGGESHYFSISEEEAIKLWGTDSDKYRDRIRGGWTGTLDLFHCLHCLNQLRKALRRDIYPEEEYRGMVHQLHCIDHLRQVIQCQATSVISPSEWHDHRGQYINPKQLHTCRNFEKLHQFSIARYNGSIAVPRTLRVPLHHKVQPPKS